jgi:hypothetical protein
MIELQHEPELDPVEVISLIENPYTARFGSGLDDGPSSAAAPAAVPPEAGPAAAPEALPVPAPAAPRPRSVRVDPGF